MIRPQQPSGGARRLLANYAHTLLAASYPVLSLYSQNLGQVEFTAVIRPWVASVVLAALLVGVFYLVLRDWRTSALTVTFFVLAFYSYGHVYDGLKQLGISGSTFVRHRYLLPLYAAFLAVAIWRLRSAHSLVRPVVVMNFAGVALVALPTLGILSYAAESTLLRASSDGQARACELQPPLDPPDIYLIVMDAYERDDILLEMHGYDNSPFLEELESLGFYVARGSLSNFRHTELSLTSILNMDYIQSFPERYSVDSNNRSAVIELLGRARVRQALECAGYRIVAFETGLYWSEWRDANYFIERDAGVLHRLRILGGMTRFELLLLSNSALRAFIDLASQSVEAESRIQADPIEEQRELVEFAFNQLDDVAELPSPKFVFVHVLSPHPPFIFGPNGEPVHYAEFETDSPDEQALLAAYADQVTYVNKRLLEAVRAIQAQSEAPPIIVLQGDHGWAERNPEDKLSILNSYHFPDGRYSDLYPTITPVNTFRIIFNRYLGGEFALLPDRSYFSTDQAVFQFKLVENTWEPGR